MAKHMDIQQLVHTECISHVLHTSGISHLFVPSHGASLQMCLLIIYHSVHINKFRLFRIFLPYDGACIYISSGSQYSESVSQPGYKVQRLHGLLQSMVPCLLYALSGGDNCKNI
jgi:hypothetical protein